MPRVFNGSLLVTPQSSVNIVDTGLSGTTFGGSGDLCLIGASGGGAPFVPQRFVNPQDAIASLRSGDLLRAVLRAFAPGPNFPGAPAVICIRANAATQAAATLVDASARNSIVLTSRDYGAYNNLVRINVSAGTTSGRKLTVSLAGNTVVRDNVGRAGFTLQYKGANTPTFSIGPVSTSSTTTTVASAITGSGTGQSITVGSSAAFAVGNQVIIGFQGTASAEVATITALVDATHMTIIAANNHSIAEPIVLYTPGTTGIAVNVKNAGADVPAEDTILPFGTYNTVQAVIDAFNSKPTFFSAVLASQTPSDPTTGLDTVVGGTTISTSSVTPTAMRMDLYAVLAALNDNSQQWVTAAAAAGAGGPPAIEAATVWHYLAGAVDGSVPPTTGNWQAAFTAAATIECSVIGVATGDATVHAMLQTHVDFESSPAERRERVGLFGGVAGETITQAIARANTLRDPRLAIVWPGILDVDSSQSTNSVVTLDPWLVAAQLGGMLCGGRIQDPLTNRFITAKGLEVAISNSDRDNLQLNGVIPIVYVPNKGYRVAHSLSTWTADTNYRKTEISTMRASDYLTKQIREATQALVGQIVEPGLLLRAYQIADSNLRALWDQGIIVGNVANPAFRKLQCSAAGDTVFISFEASIAIPANYILVTASLTAFTGTL